jgi:hypothetical protein
MDGFSFCFYAFVHWNWKTISILESKGAGQGGDVGEGGVAPVVVVGRKVRGWEIDVEGVYMHSVNIEQKTFFSILFFPFDLMKCKY